VFTTLLLPLDSIAEQEAKAAQKRRDEAKPVPRFETKDSEAAAQLRASYRLQIVQSKRAQDANGQIVFSIEDPEGRGPSIAAGVAARREELAAQHEDADAWFERQRREAGRLRLPTVMTFCFAWACRVLGLIFVSPRCHRPDAKHRRRPRRGDAEPAILCS
jgi:hypothetical protein